MRGIKLTKGAHSFGAAVAVPLILLASACDRAPVAEQPGPGEQTRELTSPRIAVANLNGQIEGLLRQIEIDPRNIDTREAVVGLLLSRTQYLGTYDDFDVAFEVVRAALESGLAPARTAALHARLLAAVHRFDEALLEIERSEELGGQTQTKLLQSIALARGEETEDIVYQRTIAAERTPTFQSFSDLAAALRGAGKYQACDEAYASARSAYRDVSPFPVAWLHFQRGLMWGEFADDAALAAEHYREAVSALPQYVVGNVHLAELEVEAGEVDRAVERLEALVWETRDPEPASRLAQFLADRDPERSKRYAEHAREVYEEHLSRYPLAFADHACEFYLGAGADAERALDLALLNLENRTTPRAYDLVIEAGFAAGMPSFACAIAEEGDRLEAWVECL